MTHCGFWSATRPHKHRTVKVHDDSLVYRLLKITLVRSTNRTYVERSRLTWGWPDTRKNEYVLTVLSLLHSFTGLTIEVIKIPRCEECGDRHAVDKRHQYWTDGT